MCDPRAIDAANTQAVVLKDAGRYDEARDYLHGGLRAARQYLGDDHPTTLSIIGNLSALLTLQGKWDEAAPLCHEVLKGRREELGERHPDSTRRQSNPRRNRHHACT